MLLPSLLHRTAAMLAAPERYKLLRLVQSQVTWGPPEIRAYQDRKVAELIRYCWTNVPFYRRHWDGAIRSPEEVQSVADLERLPTVTKDLWRANLEDLTTTDPAIKSDPARTGGRSPRTARQRPGSLKTAAGGLKAGAVGLNIPWRALVKRWQDGAIARCAGGCFSRRMRRRRRRESRSRSDQKQSSEVSQEVSSLSVPLARPRASSLCSSRWAAAPRSRPRSS